MSSMTEDFVRIAQAMAAGHQQRSAMRMQMREIAGERHADVGALLSRMNRARAAAARAQSHAAATDRRMRRHHAAALMTQFHNAMDARRHLRFEMAAAARVRAADFMQALTGSVGAMREGFAAGQQARADAWRQAGAALHRQLAAQTGDRDGARTAFRHARGMAGGGAS